MKKSCKMLKKKKYIINLTVFFFFQNGKNYENVWSWKAKEGQVTCKSCPFG